MAGVIVRVRRAVQTDEVTGFRAEGVAVDKKKKYSKDCTRWLISR